MRLRVRRGRRRQRLDGDPGLDHQARRGQRHRRRERRLDARRRSTCRPTPARRSSCASATRTDGAAQGTGPDARAPGMFVDDDQADVRQPTVFDGRRRGRRQRLDARRLQHRRRVVDDDVRPLLHRLEPAVRLLRQVPADRAVQLRLPGPAGLGGALPVPGRPAGELLGHLVLGQQREPAPRPGRDPADRLATRRRSTASTACRGAGGSRPTTRRSRWRRRTRSPCTTTGRRATSAARTAQPAVRRPPGVLERGAADRGREGAPRRRADPGAVSRTARRCGSASTRSRRRPDRSDGIGASYSVRAP